MAALILVSLASQTIGNRQLQQELAALEDRNYSLERRNRFLAAERRNLLATIGQRDRRLASLDRDVRQLEEMLAVNGNPSLALETRISHAYDELFEKQLLLRSIPRISPVPFKAITDRYGIRRHPLNGGRDMHHGVDLRARMRTPVKAAADGIVIKANRYSNGIGKMVQIQHRYGFSTVYGHLDSFDVEVGDIVQQGDVIARSGNSGLSTAPHLHYEVRYLDRRVDPQPFLEWNLEQYRTIINRQSEDLPWESLEKAIVTTVRQRLDRTDQDQQVQRSSQPTARLTAASP